MQPSELLPRQFIIKLNATMLRVKRFFFFEVLLSLMDLSQALPSHHFLLCYIFLLGYLYLKDTKCNTSIVLHSVYIYIYCIFYIYMYIQAVG